MKIAALRFGALFLVVAVACCTLFVYGKITSTEASTCSRWYQCPVSQRYGQNDEHGADLLTHGMVITALRSGTITFDKWECWDGECVMDITWRLDDPRSAGNSPYMYVQIKNSYVHKGEHVRAGQALGASTSFIEFGLTPDAQYGVSGWHWGVNVLKIWPWL